MNKEEEYKKLTTTEKYEMFWPKDTLVKRIHVSKSDELYFTENKIYTLLADKPADNSLVYVIEETGKKSTNRSSEYFDLVALPQDQDAVKNEYQLY